MEKTIVPLIGILRRLLWVLVTFCAVLLFVVVGLLFTDVTLRYFGGTLIVGLHEATGIAFMFIYFLGAAEIYARRGDIVLSTLSDALPVRARAAMYTLACAITAVAMSIVGYQAGIVTMDGWGQKTPALLLPSGLQSLPLAIGGALAGLAYLIETLAGLVWIARGTHPDFLAPIMRNYPNSGDANEYVS